MKIAICFSGAPRTLDQTSIYIKQYIGKLWHNCDFFYHTWDIETTTPWSKEDKSEPYTIDYAKLEYFNNFYKPKRIIIDSLAGAFVHFQPPTPMWTSFNRVIQMKKLYETENNFKYDVVIRIRPDLVMHSSKSLEEDLRLTGNLEHSLIFCDFNDKNIDNVRYVEDILFIGCSTVMDYLAQFDDIRRRSVLNHVDWQHHMYDYVVDGLGLTLMKMQNNLVGILRGNGEVVSAPWARSNRGSISVNDTTSLAQIINKKFD